MKKQCIQSDYKGFPKTYERKRKNQKKACVEDTGRSMSGVKYDMDPTTEQPGNWESDNILEYFNQNDMINSLHNLKILENINKLQFVPSVCFSKIFQIS